MLVQVLVDSLLYVIIGTITAVLILNVMERGDTQTDMFVQQDFLHDFCCSLEQDRLRLCVSQLLVVNMWSKASMGGLICGIWRCSREGKLVEMRKSPTGVVKV